MAAEQRAWLHCRSPRKTKEKDGASTERSKNKRAVRWPGEEQGQGNSRRSTNETPRETNGRMAVHIWDQGEVKGRRACAEPPLDDPLNFAPFLSVGKKGRIPFSLVIPIAAYAIWDVSLTPNAANTRLMVSKRGCKSRRSVLYSVSRVRPDALAISLMPRARAMSLSTANSSAGSLAARMSVKYAAIASSLSK